MDRTGHQTGGETVRPGPRMSKDDLAKGGIVRQHGDDELAVEQVGDIHRRLEAQRRELAHLLRTTHIGSHSISASLKIRGHYDSHMAEADKSDTASHGLTAIRSGRRASVPGTAIAYPAAPG